MNVAAQQKKEGEKMGAKERQEMRENSRPISQRGCTRINSLYECPE